MLERQTERFLWGLSWRRWNAYRIFYYVVADDTDLVVFVVGFGLNRLHVLPKGTGVGISRLVTMVLLPALVIHSNMTEFNLADVGNYSQMVLLGVMVPVSYCCPVWALY